MKIALVTTDFLPNIGGVAQHVLEIAKTLQEDGEDVEIITVDLTSHWNQLRRASRAERLEGFSVWRIPFVINRSVKFIAGQLSSRISSGLFQSELLKRFRYLKPDVVHWHALNTTNNPICRWHSSARVWTNHTSHFIESLNSKRRSQFKNQAEQADEIIAPSEELCTLTASLGIPCERIHFIPNGVDCDRFTPDVDTSYWRQRLQLTNGERLILCPRRLERKNGVSYFIQAAVSLLGEGPRDVTFAVAGDFSGPKSESEEEVVRALVAKSKFSDRFHMLGRVENKEMPGLYAASEFVVIPSLMEATSLSAMEAMAAGKPIISTDVGGLPFLVRDGENGFLVTARQPSELAQAMKRLLDSPSQRMEFGKNGRARVKSELDWRIIARRTKKIYQLAIERHRDSRKSLVDIAVH
jgi:glycosyltransferase involved in cell wall biosynthesis